MIFIEQEEERKYVNFCLLKENDTFTVNESSDCVYIKLQERCLRIFPSGACDIVNDPNSLVHLVALHIKVAEIKEVKE